MSVLKIKDENGNWVGIPAIKGEKGDKGDPGDAGVAPATSTELGVVMADPINGVGVNGNGVLYVAPATDEEIRQLENTNKPIVPANLETAVRAVGDTEYAQHGHTHSPAAIGAAPKHTYSTTDITAGSTSSEPEGTLHLVIE